MRKLKLKTKQNAWGTSELNRCCGDKTVYSECYVIFIDLLLQAWAEIVHEADTHCNQTTNLGFGSSALKPGLHPWISSADLTSLGLIAEELH